MQRYWTSKPKRYCRRFRSIGRKTFQSKGTVRRAGNEFFRRARVRSRGGRSTTLHRDNGCRGSGTRNRRDIDLFPSSVVSWVVFVVATKGAEVRRYTCVYPYVVYVPRCAWAVVAAILVLISEEILSNVHRSDTLSICHAFFRSCIHSTYCNYIRA
jgi:hypothetical protein